MASLTSDSSFNRLLIAGENYLAHFTALLIFGYGFLQFRSYGFDLEQWDSMLISGLVVLLLGVVLAQSCPDKVSQTLRRLLHRDALGISEQGLASLRTKLEKRAQRVALGVGIVVSAALLVAFLLAYRTQPPWILLLIEMVLGFFAGRHIGRMIAYGSLGRFLKQEGIQLEVIPGHLDGAGGLKPIGELFFFQATLLALPAVFLAIWWIIIPFWPGPAYDHWREPYALLLPVAITFEVLAFIVPLWFFHREMQQQKQKRLIEADELSSQIAAIENRLAGVSDAEERKTLSERLDLMKQQYWQIEKMPTWPVDWRTRRQFTISNAGLLIPVLGQLISSTSPWQRLLRAAEAFFENLPE